MVNSFSVFVSAICNITALGFILYQFHLNTNIRIESAKNYVLCVPIDFGHGSIVCQCNATYCDSVPGVWRENLTQGQYLQILSDKRGSRFAVTKGEIITVTSKNSAPSVKLSINRNITFQSIEGFGGAFTDATGLNIASLSKPLQEIIIRQYFDEDLGLNYTFARVPMAGTDFSIRTYSYDDFDGDDSLAHFRLQTEDITYKIPFIRQALQLQPLLKLIASPWSAPPWMKTNNAFSGKGSLLPKYYQTWAKYFLKFLESYASHNISFWGLSAQNEPTSGNLLYYPFNCMGWTAEQQRDWIKEYLGPAMKNSTFANLRIIIMDDDRINLALWPQVILSNLEAAQYVSGIGVHWYLDTLVSANLLTKTHDAFPNKWLLATEASAGFLEMDQSVILGSWERAELYAEDIISDLNHWVVGWIDWNLALNTTGGPNWANNQVDAPIIVDYYQDVIYKQPMFYALGHFSKFIPSGSVRIQGESTDLQGLSVLSCLRPDGLVAIVILNMMTNQISLQINDTHSGLINLVIGPSSIYTVIYA